MTNWNSYEIGQSKIPKRVREVLVGRETEIQHYGYLLRRTPNFLPSKSGEVEEPWLYRYEKDKQARRETELRHQVPFEGIPFAGLCEDQRSSMQALCDRSSAFKAHTAGALIVGLGQGSVFETGITLHDPFGFPYIPGSGIKGAVRNFVIETEFGSKEALAEADASFRGVFGSGGDHVSPQQGGIVFADAYPMHPPVVEEDVMNVHYQDYYQGESPPADWLSPNPITFLTVVNTAFQFVIGSRPQINSVYLRLAEHWLKDCLEEHGLGAKTMIGYGYFEYIQPIK